MSIHSEGFKTLFLPVWSNWTLRTEINGTLLSCIPYSGPDVGTIKSALLLFYYRPGNSEFPILWQQSVWYSTWAGPSIRIVSPLTVASITSFGPEASETLHSTDVLAFKNQSRNQGSQVPFSNSLQPPIFPIFPQPQLHIVIYGPLLFMHSPFSELAQLSGQSQRSWLPRLVDPLASWLFLYFCPAASFTMLCSCSHPIAHYKKEARNATEKYFSWDNCLRGQPAREHSLFCSCFLWIETLLLGGRWEDAKSMKLTISSITQEA